MRCETHYWEKAGKQNTEETMNLAIRRGRQLKIQYYVVASCSGQTTKCLLKKGKNIHIISVAHEAGFRTAGESELKANTAAILKEHGVSILTTTHFFGGLGRAIRFKFGGLEPAELAANTLRILGQGVKVCVEIAIMALDAGLIPYNKEIVSIGGTGTGADTAIVCVPQHGKDFFSFDVREIICKPRARK